MLRARWWAKVLLSRLGDSRAEEVQLGQALLTDRERILGPDHPHTLHSRNNLATAYQAAGRTAEAAALTRLAEG
jgi:hypothetical protein